MAEHGVKSLAKKMNPFFVFGLVCVSVVGLVRSENNMRQAREPSTCTSQYKAIGNNSMCLDPSPNYIEGTAGVSEEDIAKILKLHNDFRANVKPTAKAMQKLYWDAELATIAEQWAKQCFVGHERDLGKNRFVVPYGISPGQNGGFNPLSWTSAVTDWHDEVNDFEYGKSTAKVVGHYTQVVRDKAIAIGCGYAECRDTSYKRYYFCNYNVGQMNYLTPYELGDPCSGCPDKCVDGKLCDCGGKFCHNRGVLNTETCTCTCQSLWKGERCEILKSCPASDPGFCLSYTKPQCLTISNLRDYCPKMCGVC